MLPTFKQRNIREKFKYLALNISTNLRAKTSLKIVTVLCIVVKEINYH